MPIVPRVPVRPSCKAQLIEMPQPARYSVLTGDVQVHHPSLACIHERATGGKPSFALDRRRRPSASERARSTEHAKGVHRSGESRGGGLSSPGRRGFAKSALVRRPPPGPLRVLFRQPQGNPQTIRPEPDVQSRSVCGWRGAAFTCSAVALTLGGITRASPVIGALGSRRTMPAAVSTPRVGGHGRSMSSCSSPTRDERSHSSDT